MIEKAKHESKPNQFFLQNSTKVESSKAVAHLPMSSQLEYHRLLNRMKLLEKQKEQKSRIKSETASLTLQPKSESKCPNIPVAVSIQNNKAPEIEYDNKVMESPKPPLITKVPSNKIVGATTTNTSLAKKVLVKNAMIKTKDSVKVAAAKPPVAAPEQVASERKFKTASDSIVTSKLTSMTLATFAKNTPKVKVSVLANYIKRYNSQGFVIMSSAFAVNA